MTGVKFFCPPTLRSAICVQPGQATQARGEHAFFITGRILNAVRRHQNRAGKGREFLLLILPRPAVIPDQMLVLFQARIAVGRQHFAVRVDIDAHSFGLFQQFFEIKQVVAGNENRFSRDGRDANRRGHGVSEMLRVARVQQFHGLEIDFAAFQDERNPAVHAAVHRVQGQRGQGFGEVNVDRIVLFAEHESMVSVCRRALETVSQQFLQRQNVFTELFLAVRHLQHFCHFDHAFFGDRAAGASMTRSVTGRHLRPGGDFESLHRLHGRLQQRKEPVVVEINVRDRRKEQFQHLPVSVLIFFALLPQFIVEKADFFRGHHNAVLQRGRRVAFSAHADFRAARPLGSLFALKTKHRHRSLLLVRE